MRIPFTFGAVSAVVPTLSKLRLATISRLVGGPYADDAEISPGSALVIWLADLLGTDQVVDRDQQDLILQSFLKHLQEFGDKLWSALQPYEDGKRPGQLVVSHLSIFDQAYAAMSNHETLIDLSAGCTIAPPLASAPLRTVGYNLTKLFTGGRARMWQSETVKKTDEDGVSNVR